MVEAQRRQEVHVHCCGSRGDVSLSLEYVEAFGGKVSFNSFNVSTVGVVCKSSPAIHPLLPLHRPENNAMNEFG